MLTMIGQPDRHANNDWLRGGGVGEGEIGLGETELTCIPIE